MKIVVNALPYKQNSSGIGVLIRELFGAYVSVTERYCQVILGHDAPPFPVRSNTELIHGGFDHRQGLRRILFQTLLMGRKYCRDAALLTTDSKLPFFLPRSCKTVTLVTDMAVFRFPEVYQWSRVLLWRLQYRYAKRRVDCFLAISEFTKREMVYILKLPAEKIKVISCAVSSEMRPVTSSQIIDKVRERYNLPEKFILFVGNFNPRKNLERMLQAFDQAKARIAHHLVIAGEQGWKFNRESVLSRIEHKEAIHFIGFVADEDMPALYTAADLFVFPTLYEGFGIPVIEAQCCGTPVLTSDCTALPEIGGKGAWYVDPYSVDSIRDGILRLLKDAELRKQLTEQGYRNSRRFSWQNSAERLHEIIEKEVLQ